MKKPTQVSKEQKTSGNVKDEKTRRELALDQTIADSFPASDPPSSIPNSEDEDIAA
jgi:hypothetical protein